MRWFAAIVHQKTANFRKHKSDADKWCTPIPGVRILSVFLGGCLAVPLVGIDIRSAPLFWTRPSNHQKQNLLRRGAWSYRHHSWRDSPYLISINAHGEVKKGGSRAAMALFLFLAFGCPKSNFNQEPTTAICTIAGSLHRQFKNRLCFPKVSTLSPQLWMHCTHNSKNGITDPTISLSGIHLYIQIRLCIVSPVMLRTAKI